MQYSYLELAATHHEERARRLDRHLDTRRALREPTIGPVVPANRLHEGSWLRLLDRIRPGRHLPPHAHAQG
jgi:hypothetical protein